MIVSNTSPIIVLGKQGELKILKNCFENIIISQGVYDEVMEKENSIEAISLMNGIKEKWIGVEKVEINSVLNTENLGKGEKEVISLAFKKKSVLLIDDDNARKYASLLKVECHGTLYALFLAVLKRVISKVKAIEILDNLIMDGFYISIEIYSRFLNMLERL